LSLMSVAISRRGAGDWRNDGMAAENGGYCPRQVLRIEYPLLKSVPIENINQAARPLRLDSTCE